MQSIVVYIGHVHTIIYTIKSVMSFCYEKCMYKRDVLYKVSRQYRCNTNSQHDAGIHKNYFQEVTCQGDCLCLTHVVWTMT